MEPSLAIQQLLHARMASSPAITALVPADDISDVSGRPAAFPSIVIGEGSVAYSDNYQLFYERVACTVHVWTEEPGLEQAKTIAHAVRQTLKQSPWGVSGYACHGISVSSARFLRDPSGEHGHAVITIDAVMQVRESAEFGEVFP